MKADVSNRTGLAQTLFQQCGDALFLFDPASERLLDANPAAERLCGLPRDSLLKMSLRDLGRENIPASSEHRREKFLLRRQDGGRIPVSGRVTRLGAEEQTPGLLTLNAVKEPAPGHLASELLFDRAHYRTLVQNLEQCIFLKDDQFRFVAVNPPFCRAADRPEEEVLGRTDFDCYPRALAEKFRADDRQVLLHGKRLETEEQSLIGGQQRTVRVVKTPVRDDSGRPVGVLGIFWDVTEQRSLEAQLRQAQKMEAVGQLAGGVAHDFNNLLTAILGNLSLLTGAAPLEAPARELVQAAESAALRAANLTGQLLGFSRRTLLRPEPTNVNHTINEVVAMLRRTIDPRIILETHAASDLWPVLADTGQMNQVVMNLCLNARDAMPEGGRLLLQTENVVLGAEQARLWLEARSGEFVCLRVRDTGAGMTAAVRARIFEPFFTTKGPGKGTGLGLAMVFGIVKQHGGWIECDSEPDKGTCFTLHLPRHVAAGLPAAEDNSRNDGAGRGTETILFVDDEAMLRNLGRTILQRHGYKVLLASDGMQAVEVFGRERASIDLVVLDLTMPRLSGRDAFRQIRVLDPEVCVLFASGFSPEQLTAEEHEQIAGFVAKPYRPRELTALVREALDRKHIGTREPCAASS